MAKGLSSGYLPISATVVSHEIIELLREKNDEFFHGFTYSGHPTCAAVALRNIEIIEREGLVKRTAEVTGPYLSQALQRFAGQPAGGRGALAGTDRRRGDRAQARHQLALRRQGRHGRPGRARSLRRQRVDGARGARHHRHVHRRSIITQAEIDKLVAILDKSLTEAAALLG